MNRVITIAMLVLGITCFACLQAFSQEGTPARKTALTRTIRLTNLHITPTQQAKIKLELEQGDSVRIRPASVARVMKEKEIKMVLMDNQGEEHIIMPDDLDNWVTIHDPAGVCTIRLECEKEVSLPEIQLFRKSKPSAVSHEAGAASKYTITSQVPHAEDSVFTKKLTAFYKLIKGNQITFATNTTSDYQILGHWADKRSVSNRHEILNGGVIDIPTNSEYIFFFDSLTAQDEAGLPKELEVVINY